MNMPAKILALSSAALFLSACAPKPSLTPVPETPATTTTTPEAAVMETAYTYNLAAQSNSGQTGTMVLEAVDGQVKVTLDLTDLGKTSQPAHIHVGACPTPGAVKYPLTNVVNGKSTTVLSVSLEDLMAELPLAVNVHKSAAESSVYTACADIK